MQRSLVKYDRRFWERRENWPCDVPGYQFLARAFLVLGKAKYGDQWMDRFIEPGGEPEEPDDEDFDDDDAWEQWERECQRAESAFEERWDSMVRIIAQYCRAGTLETAVRSKAGGAITSLGSDVWYTENFETRFFRCEMSLDNPFSKYYPSDEAHWIYVQLKSLHHVSVNIEGSRNHLQRPNRDHKLRAIENVIVDLYGFPPQRNQGAKQCYKEIRKKFGNDVSDSTIGRAFQRLCQRNTQ